MNDEFYIGWENHAPPGIGRRVRRTVVALLALAVLLGLACAAVQRTIGMSVFEWGKVKEFTGILQSQPYPHLLVLRPGKISFPTSQSVKSEPTAFSSYPLVRPFKFGFDPAVAARLDGQPVKLQGTLIYHGHQTMIEVAHDSIQQSNDPALQGLAQAPAPARLGEHTFVGEIVDSKCYLGVMNPGALIPHRACAIRCISGGIPPVLLVRQQNGPGLCLLLVSRDGKPVNQQVLDLVAEPVAITGEVVRQGDLLVLHADPHTYKRTAQ